MKTLYGEEADHVVKNRQTFLLDLYLNLPGEYTFVGKVLVWHLVVLPSFVYKRLCVK